MELVDDRPGLLVLRVSGQRAVDTFSTEAGGHRWQRRPPNDRHGRTHTSTVTVAVLPEPIDFDATIQMQDVTIEAVRGSGPGGQHRNMRDTAVRVVHRPTGIEAHCQSERSQMRNKASALAVLAARVAALRMKESAGGRAEARRAQVGTGQRGDKRRTIRLQDGVVTDHVTGRRWRASDYLDGRW